MIGAPQPDSPPLELALANPAATEALGTRLGAALRAGDTVFLIGPMGAGKTSLARAAIAAWMGQGDAREAEAPSPTYTLAQTYEGPRGVLQHLDLFRLRSPEEAEELGLYDVFDDMVRLIEWPEILGAGPEDRLEVHLSFDGAGEAAGRRARVLGFGRQRERMDGF
ncbi:MAG: tRNA (adenosine(37)-N6)-threonylcarbamoyltransferase complex ATPase subunit type 1 TsaE [Hyphomonadaceae bacterium]|nr:tRNA (adenosine(37)-N6)-threonylcarbamoyltransferase complex ATPase subunit type 1 TsaE [Hyphomonadaceae bacterium]